MIAIFIYEYPVVLAGILIALGVLGRTAHKIYKFIDNLNDGVDYLKHEMKLNGGKTMRDAVARIEARQIEIERKLKEEEAA